MKPFLIKFAEFLNYLETCGGCSGKRKFKHCRFALECASAEVLHKKGLVKNSQELLSYSANFDRSNNHLSCECNRTNDSDGADANTGPCESEEG